MPQDVFQKLAGLVHLGVKIGPVQAGQLHMVVGVYADLVALGVHTAHQVLVAHDLLPDQKEGGLHPPLGQAVQQLGGGGAAGAVVKGQGDQGRRFLHLRLGVGGHRPALFPAQGAARRPEDGQQKREGQRHSPRAYRKSLHAHRRLSQYQYARRQSVQTM